MFGVWIYCSKGLISLFVWEVWNVWNVWNVKHTKPTKPTKLLKPFQTINALPANWLLILFQHLWALHWAVAMSVACNRV